MSMTTRNADASDQIADPVGIIALAAAIRWPMAALLWAIAAVLLTSQWPPVNADMIVRTVEVRPWWERPAAPPAIDDEALLARNFELTLAASEVVSGRWQPLATVAYGPAASEVQVATAPAVKNLDMKIRPDVVPAGAAALSPERQLVVASTPVDPGSTPAVVERRKRVVGRDQDPVILPRRPAAREPVPASHENRPGPVPPEVRKVMAEAIVERKAEARRALDEGHAGIAYDALRNNVADAKHDTEYLGLLAVAALQTGRLAEAHVVYERLVALGPEEPRWWAGLALVREALGLDTTGAYTRLRRTASHGTRLFDLAVAKLGSLG